MFHWLIFSLIYSQSALMIILALDFHRLDWNVKMVWIYLFSLRPCHFPSLPATIIHTHSTNKRPQKFSLCGLWSVSLAPWTCVFSVCQAPGHSRTCAVHLQSVVKTTQTLTGVCRYNSCWWRKKLTGGRALGQHTHTAQTRTAFLSLETEVRDMHIRSVVCRLVKSHCSKEAGVFDQGYKRAAHAPAGAAIWLPQRKMSLVYFRREARMMSELRLWL